MIYRCPTCARSGLLDLAEKQVHIKFIIPGEFPQRLSVYRIPPYRRSPRTAVPASCCPLAEFHLYRGRCARTPALRYAPSRRRRVCLHCISCSRVGYERRRTHVSFELSSPVHTLRARDFSLLSLFQRAKNPTHCRTLFVFLNPSRTANFSLGIHGGFLLSFTARLVRSSAVDAKVDAV